MEDSEYHQRYILHTDGLSAEGAKADVKKKQKLDHPPYFNSSILYLCSFLFSFFKSCLFARWTDCSEWITVLYLHLRWSCCFQRSFKFVSSHENLNRSVLKCMGVCHQSERSEWRMSLVLLLERNETGIKIPFSCSLYKRVVFVCTDVYFLLQELLETVQKQ